MQRPCVARSRRPGRGCRPPRRGRRRRGRAARPARRYAAAAQPSDGEPAGRRRRSRCASPVWQAGPSWSTLTSSVSPSQSSRTSLTHCRWPEVSPLTQYSWRLRLQYVARPVRQGPGQRLVVHPAQHQHLAGVVLLHDRGHESVGRPLEAGGDGRVEALRSRPEVCPSAVDGPSAFGPKRRLGSRSPAWRSCPMAERGGRIRRARSPAGRPRARAGRRRRRPPGAPARRAGRAARRGRGRRRRPRRRSRRWRAGARW